jgi:hypothetical protein
VSAHGPMHQRFAIRSPHAYLPRKRPVLVRAEPGKTHTGDPPKICHPVLLVPRRAPKKGAWMRECSRSPAGEKIDAGEDRREKSDCRMFPTSFPDALVSFPLRAPRLLGLLPAGDRL